MALIPTASATVGPFFRYALERPEWSDLTRKGPIATRIDIEGQVFDGDRELVGDALIEIWQANAAGRYDHPEDTRESPIDARFHGFGRAGTDNNGWYRFTTVRPGPVPGLGGALQAPHINVSIFARGLLKRLVTRIYFADEPMNEKDPVLSSIRDAAVRQTLIATPTEPQRAVVTYRFDIVLQGDGETAFFEV